MKILNSNIYRYYFYIAISNGLFFLPIVYIFFQENGLTLSEIFIIESIFAIGVVIFEVPSGAFADYFGKKLSLIIGCITWIVSCIIFFIGTDFYIFIIAYLAWALGAAFLSGADTALFYDILHNENKKEHFKKYQGTAKLIGLISISIASILGGYIASFSLRYTFILSAIFFFIMLFILLSINNIENKIEQKETYWQIISNSIRIISKSQILIWLFALSAIIGTVFKLIQPSTQIYLNLVGIDIKYFGFVSAFFFMMAAIGSKFAEKFDIIFKKFSYLILSLIIILTIFLVSQFVLKFSFLLFGFLFFSTSIISIFIQHQTLENSPQSNHSTVLSFNSLFDRLLFVILGPLWGYSLDKVGLPKTFYSTAIILFIIIAILMFIYFKILLKYSSKEV